MENHKQLLRLVATKTFVHGFSRKPRLSRLKNPRLLKFEAIEKETALCEGLFEIRRGVLIKRQVQTSASSSIHQPQCAKTGGEEKAKVHFRSEGLLISLYVNS